MSDPKKKSGPVIKWRKGYTPESKPLSEMLPDEDDKQDVPPPPVVGMDDNGNIAYIIEDNGGE